MCTNTAATLFALTYKLLYCSSVHDELLHLIKFPSCSIDPARTRFAPKSNKIIWFVWPLAMTHQQTEQHKHKMYHVSTSNGQCFVLLFNENAVMLLLYSAKSSYLHAVLLGHHRVAGQRFAPGR